MRVSGCGYAADSIEKAAMLSKAVTEVTHNHAEGLKGAEATAAAVFMARTGSNPLEIHDYITKNYYRLILRRLLSEILISSMRLVRIQYRKLWKRSSGLMTLRTRFATPFL